MHRWVFGPFSWSSSEYPVDYDGVPAAVLRVNKVLSEDDIQYKLVTVKRWELKCLITRCQRDGLNCLTWYVKWFLPLFPHFTELRSNRGLLSLYRGWHIFCKVPNGLPPLLRVSRAGLFRAVGSVQIALGLISPVRSSLRVAICHPLFLFIFINPYNTICNV